MPILTIPKKITNGRDLIVIPREEYEQLLNLGKRKVKKISELDKESEEGLKEYKNSSQIKKAYFNALKLFSPK